MFISHVFFFLILSFKVSQLSDYEFNSKFENGINMFDLI